MCSLTLGLMGAQMAMQLGQQYTQGKAQQSAYEAQAKAASFNQAAEEHRAEKVAENYAQKQHQLNDKFKLATGNARAQFGASGLDSTGGSLEDVLSASSDAYQRDTTNLLSSQREDEWASYTKQVQYLNEQNAYNQMKKNAKKQMYWNMAGTLMSGAASMYGQGFKEGVWGNSGGGSIYSGSSLSNSTRGYNFNNLYNNSAYTGMNVGVIKGY